MAFYRWLQNLRSHVAPGWGPRKSTRRGSLPRRRGGSPRAAAHRLNLEELEDRRLLAFLDPVSYGVGDHPISIAAADFNGDTFIDLAALNYWGHSVSVLPGDGAGGFGPAQSFGVGSYPRSLAAGDFDGDGDQDLATASSSTLSVLDNNGDGAFAAPVSVSLSHSPRYPSVAVGDFDADGKMDLAVVSNHYYQTYCYYYCYGVSEAKANVLLGDDSGGFNETASVSLNGFEPTSVALGDVNNDDKLDLIAGNGWSGLDVLLGNGDGTLQSPSHYATGDTDESVAVGDLNGDGNLDLATAQIYGDKAAVLLGDGSGAFPTANRYAAGDAPNTVVLADFDRDGRLDLVTSNYLDDISLLRGNGDGTFQAPLSSPAGDAASNAVVADFNGDGFPDVVVGNHTLDTVSVLLNDGDWPGPGVPTVTIGDATVTEGHTGAANASFSVTLSNDPLDTVTIHYATANGSATTADGDYQSAAGALTFHPGDPLAQTVLVPVNGDRRGETEETFAVHLTSAAGAEITDGQGVGTILDDEPRVSTGDAAVAEGDGGTVALSFTVTLSKVYDADVTVSFVTEDNTATTADDDYQAGAGDVVIPAGETTAPINVLVNGDTKPEADEYLLVNLSSITAVVVDGQGDGVIHNDDDFLTKFYVVDSSADRTYEYQADGQAVENYRLRSGNNDPRGAASYAAGDRVWVIDNDDYVYVYDAAGAALGAWKANGLSTPDGIASDGTDLWIVDRGKDRVYRYAGAAARTSGSASPTSSFALNSGNRNPKGIETNGVHLWVVNDDKTNKVFKYTLSGTLVGSWTISGNNTTPTGITLDPSNPSDIWIVDSGRDQVFQYTAAAGRTSGSQSPSAVFSLAAGNTNPQGIADPPPAEGRFEIEPLEDSPLAFSPAINFAVGLYPRDLEMGDFNGDNQPDLVTADSGADSVSVLLGNPDGSFQQPALTSATGPTPQSVAVGDFNGDGNLDLATGNYDYYCYYYGCGYTGDNDVSILLGQGDGTFADPIPYSVPDASRSIATGDLNADGDLDLVVTSSDPYGVVSYVNVLLGQGDGDFAPAATYGPTYGTHFFSLALADFDGDSATDVAVTDSSQGTVKIFLGSPDGVLQPPTDVAVGVNAYSVAVGDFNADQNVDLVAINSSQSAGVFLGNGDGTFQAGQTFAAGANPHATTAGDVNGDGALDVVVTNFGSTGAVSVLLGDGEGSFALPISAPAGFNPVSLVVADFNGDDRLDAAAANLGSHNVSVLMNDGNWNAPPPPQITIDDVTKKEGANNKNTVFTFTLTLSAPSTQSVTVNYSTADGTATAGSDYLAKAGSVTFAPGQTSQQITVTVKGDKLKEANETFFVNLTGAIGGVIADGLGVGTILNDDGGARGKKASAGKAVDAAIVDWMLSERKKRNR